MEGEVAGKKSASLALMDGKKAKLAFFERSRFNLLYCAYHICITTFRPITIIEMK
jgi:hypothetical protein